MQNAWLDTARAGSDHRNGVVKGWRTGENAGRSVATDAKPHNYQCGAGATGMQ
jgi:hypothetical protein